LELPYCLLLRMSIFCCHIWKKLIIIFTIRYYMNLIVKHGIRTILIS
jgi:hypothetical protein